ncbi:MAG: transposase, partial [Candidatus Methanomethylophilus sp.]|nr:transposase [Methanomethylophilus sp.]
VHSCPFCGFTADRDVNGAKNILRRTLAKISGMDRPSRSPPAEGQNSQAPFGVPAQSLTDTVLSVRYRFIRS